MFFFFLLDVVIALPESKTRRNPEVGEARGNLSKPREKNAEKNVSRLYVYSSRRGEFIYGRVKVEK